ncbi:MAG: family 10 glycosylhydrolase, partial [Clostridia bacterium]|nr:family 10 glycosylhydrolase [Clostridia bacterium]
MKKTVMWIMIVALLLSALPFTAFAEAVEVVVDGFDCTRDAGKLIVYTDEYGESTGTNQWGAEAVVGSDNRVQSITKGNAPIPEGGFVVSGHDDEENNTKFMKTWIFQNIAIGDYVYVDKRTCMLTVSEKELAKESPFFSFDNPADGINVSRGEDKMILYTPEYGKTTGTNEYGYEVVVEDGVITKLGGNNSTIPQNGYVVSLHGSVARWMRLKIVKGMLVEYDPETLNTVFYYSAEGLEKATAYAFDSAQKAIEEAKTTFVYADHAATQTALDALREDYDAALKAFKASGDENDFADACDGIIQKADRLSNALCESYSVQYRGVWVRPSQGTPEQVELFIKKLHEASINFVCVEGWFENGVIMEVPEDSLFGRHPRFNYDVLQAYIDVCHKYDMECHLWMPILNVGSFTDDGYEENTVTGRKPEWLSLNNIGQPYNKYGFMMIDPANREACDYLLDFYKYIVTTYDIDCFEMDYIRYFETSLEHDYGYTEAAFEGFEEAYGYGVTPTYNKNEPYWEDWCQFRRDCVTGLVRDIREMMNKEAPDMMLAADVAFPFEHALNKVYQNFPQWLEEGLVDILHPMAYGDGYGEEICESIALGGERCMVVTGLGAQTDFLGAEELERQAREDNSYGAYGDCYFEANTYFSDQVPDAVKETVYRNEAMPPFLDVDASLAASLDYMIGRIDDIIAPLGGMSEEEIAAVKQAVEAAKEAIVDGSIPAAKLTALHGVIEAVANEHAKNALTGDLHRTE